MYRFEDETIAAFYTAAVDPSQWGNALDAFKRLAGARAANCFVHDALTGTFLEYRFSGYGEHWADRYAAHYHGLDLARRVLLREPAGRMYPMHRYINDSMVKRSEYYQDFYIAEGLRYSCGGTLFSGNRRLILAAHRPVGHQPYDGRTVAALQRVLNHLPSVFRVRELSLQFRQGELTDAMINALPRAVLVVDAHMSIRYLNASAEALLRTSAEVSIRAQRLGMIDTQLSIRLAHRVQRVCAPVPDVDPIPLYATNPTGRPSLELHVVPLGPQLVGNFVAAEPMAMVLIRRPFFCGKWPADATRPYGLTQAEISVAQALVEGLTPAEYAAQCGVKISTVRSQIKSIMAKTGTRRATEVATLFSGVEMAFSPPAKFIAS